MKNTVALFMVTLLWFSNGISAAEESSGVLIRNVNVFDGKNNKLHPKMNVLIEGNIIKVVSQAAMPAPGATVIEGDGRTLMPGLIDGHAHIMVNADYNDVERNMDAYDLGIRSIRVVENFLMDGFTSVRDMGGPLFATKRAVDGGLFPGPRLYPSGAFISQTSGHGDFRDRADAGMNPESSGDVSNFTRFGIGTIADGVPEVLKATRTNLRNGATQIKIMAGGGGSSRFDPIDTTQYSTEEICAMVEAAKDWGTYVGAHIFTDRAINRALDCGVKSFEHGFFASEKTYQRIAKEGAYVVPQTWGLSPELENNPLMPPAKIPLVKQLQEKYGNVGCEMLDAGVKVVFASDWVGVIEDADRSRRFEIYWRTQMFGCDGKYDANFEVLKQLTSVAGELIAESGPRNDAPGKLGVVEVGAAADLLLVDGNPLKDISVIGGRKTWFSQPAPSAHPINTLRIIMKDGVIYKNTL
jgi:imidazolonepropionase-like amidohydrolase